MREFLGQHIKPLTMLMCKIWSLILNFLRESMTFREHKKILVNVYTCTSKSQFVTIGPAKFLKNRSRNIFFMAKNNLE